MKKVKLHMRSMREISVAILWTSGKNVIAIL
jgi:hypothetical protein